MKIVSCRDRLDGGGRLGVSFVEILFAMILMAVVAIPLVDALVSLRTGTHTSNRRETALYLGQAIIEDVNYYLYGDASKLIENLAGMPLEERLRLVFAGLAESNRRIASVKESDRSKFFLLVENVDGSGMHPVIKAKHPETYAMLEGYTCQLDVITPFPPADGEEASPELAEIKVTLQWKGGKGLAHDRSLELYTIVTKSGRSYEIID